MPHTDPPRKISMAYMLGLSPHPFKQAKPQDPPPRPKEPNAFVNMMTTPGAVLEWAASDGRKGKLSTPGPPKLTSRNLAKVPSEMPMAKKTASTQAHRASKEQSRKSEKKVPKEEVQGWGADNGVTNDWEKAASAAGSKKSKKEETPAWAAEAWNPQAGSVKSKDSKKGGSKDGRKDKPATDIFGGAANTWGNNATTGDTGANAAIDSSWGNADTNANDNKDEGQAWDNNTAAWGATSGDAAGGIVGSWNAGDASAWNTDTITGDNAKADESAKDNDTPAQDSSDWTAEKDAELMKRKTENESWAQIMEALGKDKNECAERFKKIKPADWRPGGKKGGGGGSGGARTDKRNKDRQQHQKGNDTEKAKEDDASSDNFMGLGGGLFGSLNIDDNVGGGGSVQSPVKVNAFGAFTYPWATRINTPWDQQTQQEAPAVNDLTNAVAAAVKSPSSPALKQQSAHHASSMKSPTAFSTAFQDAPKHSTGNTELHDTFHDIYPDSNFSQQDILVLAKILKTDHHMLWNRVASRFRDKTGRDLHPGTFEEKVTGRRFKEGSEGSGRNWR